MPGWLLHHIAANAVGVVQESWEVLVDASPYVLFGFLIAGLIKAYLPEQTIAKSMGRNGIGSVIRASLIGIPLPLCSCSVIPVAAGLRQQGASTGATTAFLISTPESGVDSVAITWSLMDPVMTLVRPLAAFFTATLGGFLVSRLPAATAAVAPVAADSGSS